MDIAIIGEKDFVWGFEGVGIDVYCVNNASEARTAMEEAIKKKCSIIYITETHSEELMALIHEVSTNSPISIVVIPGIGKRKNLTRERLRKLVEKAAGVDIFSE